jgi:hypothetical protein
MAHAADGEFQGVPFPTDRFELPSPEIYPSDMQGGEGYGELHTVQEDYPPDGT